MGNHFPPYIYSKRGTFYFSRRIPKDIQEHFNTPRITCSLKTKSLSQASRLVKRINEDLEDEWWQMRRKNAENVFARFLKKQSQPQTISVFPTLINCRDVYVEHKGAGKNKAFFHSTNRAIDTVIKLSGDKPVDHYTKQDALVLRNHLKAKGLAVTTSRRMFSVVRAVMNFGASENGLELTNPFSKVFLGENEIGTARLPIPLVEIMNIQQACRSINDERRWLIALLSDSGMRLSEAIGLTSEDFKLDSDVPHLVIKPHQWRPLKTKASRRLIPLVGASLWAAQQVETSNQFAFPSYCDGLIMKSNSASQALNKWMGTVTQNRYVLHGFRHAFRDRLRAVECPSDVIDQLGGWASSSVGQSYGAGHPLKALQKWMRLIAKH